MTTDALTQALAMARDRPVLVATADADGWPHVASAGRLAADASGQLLVTAWFCPGTLQNVQENPRLALVVWDPGTDRGFQLLGRVQQLQELAVMDGYAPDLDRRPAIPQVERQLVIRVDKVLAFCQAPHSDLEI